MKHYYQTGGINRVKGEEDKVRISLAPKPVIPVKPLLTAPTSTYIQPSMVEQDKRRMQAGGAVDIFQAFFSAMGYNPQQQEEFVQEFQGMSPEEQNQVVGYIEQQLQGVQQGTQQEQPMAEMGMQIRPQYDYKSFQTGDIVQGDNVMTADQFPNEGVMLRSPDPIIAATQMQQMQAAQPIYGYQPELLSIGRWDEGHQDVSNVNVNSKEKVYTKPEVDKIVEKKVNKAVKTAVKTVAKTNIKLKSNEYMDENGMIVLKDPNEYIDENGMAVLRSNDYEKAKKLNSPLPNSPRNTFSFKTNYQDVIKDVKSDYSEYYATDDKVRDINDSLKPSSRNSWKPSGIGRKMVEVDHNIFYSPEKKAFVKRNPTGLYSAVSKTQLNDMLKFEKYRKYLK